MAKLPTFEETVQEVAQRALDECEYEGKTLREWIEIIKTQRGTNLAEVSTDVPDINVGELISRQAAIDALDCINGVEEVLRSIPSAQPEVKQISYTDCANALLKMWMDNVLTDGEYNRIADKLNKKWER